MSQFNISMRRVPRNTSIVVVHLPYAIIQSQCTEYGTNAGWQQTVRNLAIYIRIAVHSRLTDDAVVSSTV